MKGLFYGGGASQLIAQIIGSAIITGASFAIGMALMYATKATGQLRVSEKGEKEGLDYHEHGAVAYPEFSIRHLAVSATPEPSVLKGLEKKEAEKVGAK